MKNVKPAPKADIKIEDIIKHVEMACLSCYGVSGIINKGLLTHPDTTKKGSKEPAVFVKKNLNQTFVVDVYLVVTENIKITETLAEAQKIIKYNLDKKFPKLCLKVNVYAEKVVSK